jgi:hypothetical protein
MGGTSSTSNQVGSEDFKGTQKNSRVDSNHEWRLGAGPTAHPFGRIHL